VSLADFPRYPLLFGPSPVHPLDRLTAHLGGASIWAKREDCNSGLAFGGNKTRKLEYLVPDALAQGADTLVSIGGVQSNHTRQVAAVAAKLGLKARLVQESWVDWPDSVNDRVGNILLSRIMGADVRLVEEGFGIDPRRDDRRLRRAGPAAAGDRHRRVGPDRGDPAQVEKIARNTAELIGLGRDLRDDEITVLEGWAGTCGTTRSPCWRAGPGTTTASRYGPRWTRSG
jgi:Pyridoxal-phosphate dependent enzyme